MGGVQPYPSGTSGHQPVQPAPVYRIKHEVVALLATVAGVRCVASFGSLAEGRADAWSDLDLLVACEQVDRTAWLAAAALRAAKPVIFYRPFTGVPQPSGRFWFEDELPFHRLDVSFHAPDAFAAVCRDGLLAQHPVVVRVEYLSSVPLVGPAWTAGREAMAPALAITGAETDAGRLLYQHLEAVKARRRGRTGKRDSQDTRAALLARLAVPLTAAGGDFERLARACLDL